MKYKKVKLSVVLLFGLGLSVLQAQEAIPATGGDGSGSGGSVSYSIGQVVYTTNTGTSGSVAQGIQQVFEISVVNGLEEFNGINLVVSAYPNPATGFIKLKVDASAALSDRSISYQLFDSNGKLLENKKITCNETNIAMDNFVPATYFLKVIAGIKEIKTFKIIKK